MLTEGPGDVLRLRIWATVAVLGVGVALILAGLIEVDPCFAGQTKARLPRAA